MISTSTREIVKSTIPALEAHGEQITDVFYRNLFKNHSDLKHIFNMSNQREGTQSRSLSQAILQYAKALEHLDTLKPLVVQIANKHVSLGVQPDQYAIIGETLIGAIKEVLKLNEDDEILTAWAEAYEQLAGIFIEAEEKIYHQKERAAGGWRGFRTFYIDRIVDEAEDIKSFYLTPEDDVSIPEFKGGEFLSVRVKPQGSRFYQIRQYSMSSDRAFRITVKKEPKGIVSSFLHQCHEGDRVEVQPPVGAFTLSESQKPKILISGGIGITPLYSMLDQALIDQKTQSLEFLFIQCARDFASVIFHDQLNEFATKPSVNYKLCLESEEPSDHTGYVNEEVLRDWLCRYDIDPSNAEVYFCGPQAFMQAIQKICLNVGFSKTDLYCEEFGPSTLVA